MTHPENILQLRKLVADTVKNGIVPQESKEIYEATLLQILNESERNKQKCLKLSDDLRRQAAAAEAQASGYSQVSSIIFNILNGYIGAADRAAEEEKERAEEAEKIRAEEEADKTTKRKPNKKA